MAAATVTSKGQITIPVQVRNRLGLGAGDRVEFVELEKGEFAIIAATRSIRELKGVIRKPKRPVTIAEMNAAILESAARLDRQGRR